MSTTNDTSGETSVTTNDLELAGRYHVERTWRQIRNGRTAAAATGGADDGQLGVRLSLQGGQLIESRSDLVQDEESYGRGDSNVPNKPPDGVE